MAAGRFSHRHRLAIFPQTWLKSLVEARVQRIAQTVADEIEAQRRKVNGKSWDEHERPRVPVKIVCLFQHVTPGRIRDLNAKSKIRECRFVQDLSLIHISEPTRRTPISYAVFCLKKKN